MRFLDNFREAIGSLLMNKMRSLLTMLGIIIGIGAVIAIMTLGSSMTAYITETMGELGINNITVSLQAKTDSGPAFRIEYGGGGGIAEKDLITEEMLDGLKEEYPDEIKALSISESLGSGQTEKGADYANLTLTGVNEEYMIANDLTLLRGRFVSREDDAAGRRLAVVSDKLVSNIFGDANPLGQEIVIRTQGHIDNYTIVGVYEQSSDDMMAMMMGSTSSDYDMSTDVYIPLSVAKKVLNTKGYSSFTVVSQTGVNSTEFGTKVESYFNRYYNRNEDYGVSAFSMESMVESITEMMGTLSLAIAAIAAISLLVGGIGVMNIMIVSITERTREIGTRKAIGATNGEIRAQFIVESVVICLVGGIIGIILGIVLGAVGASIVGVTAAVSASSILLSVGVSSAIGVFFGFYPANKAAKMDPIDALRYE
ncbi:MAG: ABC transporter permease [Clostridiales Family XIII bacterium]|nr:ABC transporter permease [Clostridiales Family XIII bacterium]